MAGSRNHGNPGKVKPGTACSDVTDTESSFHSLDRVTYRNEFLAQVPLIPGLLYCFYDRRIIKLLGFINFVSAGNTRSVIVPYVLVKVADGPDYVAFHYLHMVDVIKQLEPF